MPIVEPDNDRPANGDDDRPLLVEPVPSFAPEEGDPALPGGETLSIRHRIGIDVRAINKN